MSDIYTIKPIRRKGGSSLPVKGAKLIPELNARVFLSAKTNSGKSTVLHHIIKNTMDKRSIYAIFSSTVHIDPIYISMVKMLKRKKCQVYVFDSIIDDKSGENLVESFLKGIGAMGAPPDDKEEEIVEVKPPLIKTDFVEPPVEENDRRKAEEVVKKKKEKVYKDQVPLFTMIIDDMSKQDLRSDFMYNFLKKSRHYGIRCFISSQNITDLAPNAFAQLSQVLVWGGFPQPYIHKLWERMNMTIDFKTFWKLYLYCTKEKHSFVNIDLLDWKIKKNFSANKLKF